MKCTNVSYKNKLAIIKLYRFICNRCKWKIESSRGSHMINGSYATIQEVLSETMRLMEEKIDKCLENNEILENGVEFEVVALTLWVESSKICKGWIKDASCWYWASMNEKGGAKEMFSNWKTWFAMDCGFSLGLYPCRSS